MKKLISFTFVFLSVPRKRILKALKSEFLESKEIYYLMRIRAKTLKAINKLQHLLSILDKILNKFS